LKSSVLEFCHPTPCLAYVSQPKVLLNSESHFCEGNEYKVGGSIMKYNGKGKCVRFLFLSSVCE
jgi:hypothetical protein